MSNRFLITVYTALAQTSEEHQLKDIFNKCIPTVASLIFVCFCCGSHEDLRKH